MPRTFDIEQLRTQARDLCRDAGGRGELSVARIQRVFPEYKLGDPLKIAQAYLVLAREHGYPSWPRMKAAFDGPRNAPGAILPGIVGDEALDFKGSGMVEDSLARAVVAVAKHAGVSTTYESVTCLLGSAFAPAVDPHEDCLSHWCVNGAFGEAGLPAACAAIGLRAEPLVPVEGSPSPARAATVDAVRGALDAGDAVIVGGGWAFAFGGPRGFVHWAWAGIVTDAEPDGTVVGACLNGQIDNPLDRLGDAHFAGGVWRISRGAAPADGHEGTTTLANAVDRIRGRGLYRAGRRWGYLYGLDAMDAWIAKMADVPGFCAHCHGGNPGAGRGDALTNAKRAVRASRVAAEYLAREHPAHAEAAARYAAIAGRLDRTVQAKDSPDAYESILGDLSRQRDHVGNVLLPVRADLERIAILLEGGTGAR